MAIASCTPFSTAGMNWRGIAPPTMASDELEARTPLKRLHTQIGDAELPVTAGLLLVLALGLGRAGDRLPVRDPERLGLDLDAELAEQLLARRSEGGCRPCRTRWSDASRRRARTARVMSSSCSRCRAVISLSSSPLAFGCTAIDSKGVGAGRASMTTGLPFGARVSPVRTSASFGTAMMSPACASLTGSPPSRASAAGRAGAPRRGCAS